MFRFGRCSRSPSAAAAVVAMAVVAGGTACSRAGDGHGTTLEIPAGSYEPCRGPEPGPPATGATTDIFSAGGLVETEIASKVGWDRSSVELDGSVAEPTRDAATSVPDLQRLQSQLLDIPAWVGSGAGEVAGPAHRRCAAVDGEVVPGTLDALSALLLGRPPRLKPGTPSTGPLAGALDDQAPLVGAFEAVFAARRGWAGQASVKIGEVRPKIEDLENRLEAPAERALAAAVLGMAAAERWRLAAVRSWYGSDGSADLPDLVSVMASREVPAVRARSFDHALMASAAVFLAQAVERLAAQLRDDPLPPDLDFNVSTPLGDVVLKGDRTGDTHVLPAPALIVDQGGDDTYEGAVAGPAKPWIPMSVAIDLGGNDRYRGGRAVGTQGAGILSFGFLLDASGDDTYEAQDLAQGASFLGAGALLDAGGSDTYTARYSAQGSAELGLGVAVDLAGTDQWRLTSFGQGYGATRGGGALVDIAGDDRYDADDTSIINPARDQAPEHNLSLAQGAGTGHRAADNNDSTAGGIGLLVDAAGADHYRCGVFCQGAGYWYGIGSLVDGDGDDSYTGVYYVQGSGAHFAVGALLDRSGNDTVDATIYMAQGAGQDGTAGYYVDGGGDDRYRLTNHSHGVANDGGFGFFVDRAGADVHDASGADRGAFFGQTASVDMSATPRAGARALGLYLDLAGADAYPGAPASVADGATWRLPGRDWAPPQHAGAGRDAP